MDMSRLASPTEAAGTPVAVLISTADTELLAARASEACGARWRVANPARLPAADVAPLVDGAAVVVVRLLGGERAWPDGLAAVFAAVFAAGLPTIVLGGEATPDADLMARSTAPAGVATQALAYLAEGGVANLAELHRFLCDTLLFTGYGFAPPAAVPAHGAYGSRQTKADRPTVGVVFYRAHATSGNTGFVDVLCDALEAAGANARPVFCTTLRGLTAPASTSGGADDGGAVAGGGGDGGAVAGGGGGDGGDGGVLADLGGVDALVVTVLAAGGTRPADAGAGGDEDAWDVGALAALDVPVVQGLCLTSSRSAWEASDAGLSPMDAAMQVAIPEFDGRIVAVPFSFKEEGPGGVPVYVADPERAARVAGIAVRAARLRHVPNAEKKVALVLSSYPTKHSRVGNAVGLDTPASAVLLLDALAAAGYDLGGGYPGQLSPRIITPAPSLRDAAGPHSHDTPHTSAVTAATRPRSAGTPALRSTNAESSALGCDGEDGEAEVEDGVGEGVPPGDALIHTLIAAGGHDVEWLTAEQMAAATARIPASDYARWFERLPASLRSAMTQHWGPPPGTLYVDDPGADAARGTRGGGDTRGAAGAREPAIVLAALRFGNILLMIQPPRGFGENPVAIYHDPDLPASHHYLAAYRWLDEVFGADAVVHLGKHGTLEWLPGKGLGMSAGCAPDAVLGSLPLVYPFLVNDPGEGTQAKRRAHAVIVDHLVPPMARADTYGELAKLEQLLDEHATLAALDPAKLPAIRAQIWTLIQAAKLHHDLGLDERPEDAEFDEFLLHVDGYLCEVKDTQIRDGLHILGQAPEGEARVNLVLAILRANQMWGGQAGAVPGLRAALGHAEQSGPGPRAEVDAFEARARALVAAMENAGWDPAAVPGVVRASAFASDVSDTSDTSDTSAISGAVEASAVSGATGIPETAGSGASAALAVSAVPPVPPVPTEEPAGAPTGATGAAERGDHHIEGPSPAPGATNTAAPAETEGTAYTTAYPAEAVEVPQALEIPEAPEAVEAVERAERTEAVARVLAFAAAEVVPRLGRTGDEIANILRALDGRFVPPGPSGSPTRGLVNVLPTGRNFASVDPKAIPSRLAWETGKALADSLLARYLADNGAYPASVGLTVWGTSAMRTQGDDVAEVLWLLGCRPTWDDASRRVTGFEVVGLAELGRPRVDVVVRISGFFRDAFPHVVALLDQAVQAVAALDEPDADNALAAHVRADLADLADIAGVGAPAGADGGTAGTAGPGRAGMAGMAGSVRTEAFRRATTRIFGSKPGAYGAGLLPLIDSREWRSDADLAEVYAVWGGYAYGRGLDGRAARADMEAAFRRIQVAVKNQDTREHDLVDSDDYFQYHGGMVAAVRALAGAAPAAYVGDSALPDAVRTRTLQEETHRVFRARVVNPRWVAAMRRHGYKGAFELAATVDYLFGYDATAGVVQDWMYTALAESYVFDEQTAEFMRSSNPWALRGIAERLLEAADRGLWENPDAATLDRLRATYLELEGDLEAHG